MGVQSSKASGNKRQKQTAYSSVSVYELARLKLVKDLARYKEQEVASYYYMDVDFSKGSESANPPTL